VAEASGRGEDDLEIAAEDGAAPGNPVAEVRRPRRKCRRSRRRRRGARRPLGAAARREPCGRCCEGMEERR
jgi:hypothetical protein